MFIKKKKKPQKNSCILENYIIQFQKILVITVSIIFFNSPSVSSIFPCQAYTSFELLPIGRYVKHSLARAVTIKCLVINSRWPS